jgi:hypothetical protein
LQAQRAVEALTHEAVLVQRADGSIVYCNDLLLRLAEVNEPRDAADVLKRMFEPLLYKELLDGIATSKTGVVERTLMIPMSAQNGAYDALCTVKTAPQAELRVWVFQLHTKEDTVGPASPAV